MEKPSGKERNTWKKEKEVEGIGSLSSSSSFPSSRSSSSFFLSSKVHGWRRRRRSLPTTTATFLPYSFLSFPYLPSRLLFLLPFSPLGLHVGEGESRRRKTREGVFFERVTETRLFPHFLSPFYFRVFPLAIPSSFSLSIFEWQK